MNTAVILCTTDVGGNKHGLPQCSVVKESACRSRSCGTVQSLGEEDPLKEGMAAHASILPENSMDM